MSWVKTIYIVQTKLELKAGVRGDAPPRFQFETKWDPHSHSGPIHNYRDFTAHLNRINKAGKFKTNQACWIMQQGVPRAWHAISTGRGKTGRFFSPVPCDLFDCIKQRTKEERCCMVATYLKPWWFPVETAIKPEHASECNISNVITSLSQPLGLKEDTNMSAHRSIQQIESCSLFFSYISTKHGVFFKMPLLPHLYVRHAVWAVLQPIDTCSRCSVCRTES